MGIPADIAARLSDLGVPVLLPEQAHIPGDYADLDTDGQPKEGARTGLLYYLEAEAPAGFVQIEQPLTISTDDYVARYWVPVSTIATTEATAQALSEQVRRALCGTPWEPGPYARALADRPRLVSGGFFLCRPTYDISEIDGVIAV
jgi:hypothetical protein